MTQAATAAWHALQSGEEVYGHAGMLGAAAAVWEDLRSHHLLAAFLNLPPDEDCRPHQEAGEHRQYDTRMSHSEKERHLEWEAGEPAHSMSLRVCALTLQMGMQHVLHVSVHPHLAPLALFPTGRDELVPLTSLSVEERHCCHLCWRH